MILKFRVLALFALYFTGEIRANVEIKETIGGNLQVEWNEINANILRYKSCDEEEADYKYQYDVRSPAIIEDVAPNTCVEVSVGDWVPSKRITTARDEEASCFPCSFPFVALHGISGSCFLIQYGLFTWDQAKSECEKSEARLAVLDTSWKNEAVKNALRGEHRNSAIKPGYWIDGTDQVQEGNWRWNSTGYAIEFSDWIRPNQPDDFKGREDCLQLWGKYRWEWNDSNCSNKFGVVCEKPFSKC